MSRAPKTHLLALLALSLIGCDGGIGVAGTTYRWVNPGPGAKSFIAVDEPLPKDLTLEPLSEVEVTLYYSSDEVHSTDETAKLFRDQAVSSQDGRFAAGGVAPPGRYESAIEATRAGCQGVVHKFEHDRSAQHRASVVLVCGMDEQPSPPPSPEAKP